jgi:hypothetical protein
MISRSRSAPRKPKPPNPRHLPPSQPRRDTHLAISAADDEGPEERSTQTAERDAIRKFVARTRAEQGLPPTIEDPTTLDKIAAVFRLVKDSKAGR